MTLRRFSLFMSIIMDSNKSYLVTHEVGSTSLISYHSLLNEPHLLEFDCDEDKRQFLSAIHDGPIESGFESFDRICGLSDYVARQIMLRRKNEYVSTSNQRISFLGLMVAENCNLACSYCIGSTNMADAKRSNNTLMPWYIAKRGIDWYFSIPSRANEYYVNLSGGEPLINKEVVRRSIEYVKLMQVDKPIRITINTNATLIDEPFADFLTANNVAIATSLDGNPQASDKVRITRGGLPVSSTILSRWRTLIDSGCELSGFMATFNDKNIVYLDTSIIDFAIEFGFSWLRIACDVIHLSHYPVKDAIEKIWSVYKYGAEKGVLVEGFWSAAINNLTRVERNPNNTGFFCGAVSGETVSVHPDGRLSACGFSSGNIGNVLRDPPFYFDKHRSIIAEYFPGSREFCKGCSIEGSCAGGCSITREVSISENDESAIQYNCELYRELTRRLLIDHFQKTASPAEPSQKPASIGYLH